jgi:hypothetical protein
VHFISGTNIFIIIATDHKKDFENVFVRVDPSSGLMGLRPNLKALLSEIEVNSSSTYLRMKKLISLRTTISSLLSP